MITGREHPGNRTMRKSAGGKKKGSGREYPDGQVTGKSFGSPERNTGRPVHRSRDIIDCRYFIHVTQGDAQ